MPEDYLDQHLTVQSDSSPLKEADVPISKQWLTATDPRFMTPKALEKGGMTRIAFSKPNGESVVNVYRTIERYKGGGIGVQDEIHPFFENTGSQLNFEWDPSGRLIQFNPSTEPNNTLQRCIELIQDLAMQKGATITSIHQDHGIERTFVSDGSQWIDAKTRRPSVVQKTLSSSRLQLK